MKSRQRLTKILLASFLCTAPLWAQAPQPCVVELFIGDPEFSSGDGGPALDAKFWTPTCLEVGPDGSIYVSDSASNRIRKIDPQGTINTIAGTGIPGDAGEGGPAIAAQLSLPTALALAPNGSLYFVDDQGRRIRRITSSGVIEFVEFVPRGDARYLAVSGGGDVYFSRGAEGVFQLLPGGTSQRIAGGGNSTADGVDALEFDFGSAGDLLVAANGDLLVADGPRVLVIGQDGKIRTLLGGGATLFQEGVTPLDLDIGLVFGLGETNDGTILVASSRGVFSSRDGVVNRRSTLKLSLMASNGTQTVFSTSIANQIVRLLVDDTIQTVAGVDLEPFYEPGRPLDQTLIFSARGLQTDSQGRLYYYDSSRTRIFRTTLDGRVEVFAGGGQQPPASGIPAKGTFLFGIGDTTIDETDRLSISVRGASGTPALVLRIELDGTLTVVAGGGLAPEPTTNNDIPALSINFNGRAPVIAAKPGGLVYFSLRDRIYEAGADGNARFVFDFSGATPSLLRSDPSGGVLVVAGSIYFFEDSASPPTVIGPSPLPAQVVRSEGGSLFLIDQVGRTVRIGPDGHTTDFVSRESGFSFNNGRLDLNSGFAFAADLALNQQGDLFIADNGLSRIFVIRGADTCKLDRPFVAATLHGASFNGFALTPGVILSVFGQHLGPESLSHGAPGQSPTGTWQTNVGGLEVLVNGRPAPIIFSRTDQAAFVVANEIRDTARIQYRYNGLLSSSGLVPVSNAAPGIFTANSSGGGQAAALNQDSSINSASNPSAPGSVIVLYLTGAGLTNPPSVTGSLNDFPLPQLVEQVEVTINGVAAVVEFAGPAPGLISGVVQVNARIPADTPSGPVEINVKIGGVLSPGSPTGQPVTISIQ